MSYLATENVVVFPSTKRANNQVSARLLTEQAIVGIVNKLIESDGFVITPDEKVFDSHYFEFNIHGYYFKVSAVKLITDLFNLDGNVLNIYGNIIIEKSGNYDELFGQDDDNQYKGIQFTSTPLEDTSKEIYSLLLFTRDNADGDWYVPTSSRIRYTFNSINISTANADLDGGEI